MASRAAAAAGHDIHTGSLASANSGDFEHDDVSSHLSEDASRVTTETVASDSVQPPSERSREGPAAFRGQGGEGPTVVNSHQEAPGAGNRVPAEITVEADDAAPVRPPPANEATQDDPQAPPDIPKGKSIAHDCIIKKKAVFLSLDVETGGEFCGPSGLLQLSAELFRMDIESKRGKDVSKNIRRPGSVFNKYINPGEDAIWNEAAARSSHQLTATDPRILNADDIGVVWRQFEFWIGGIVSPDETVILVAYNGATCDMKWLWRLTHAPNSPYNMPPPIKFFMREEDANYGVHSRSCGLE